MSSNSIGPIDALGTQWYIELFEQVDLLAVEKRFRDELEKFNANYSRFLENSLIGKLNISRAITNPPEEFIHLLQLGQIFYQVTNGCFNFLTGGLQVTNGYGNSNNPEKISPIGNPLLDLSITNESIQLTGNSLIDLGGYGKGYFIDKFASILKDEFNLRYFLINGGGDLYATSDNDAPIKIALELPETKSNSEKSKYFGFVQLTNQAVCASSPYKRSWRGNSDTLHTHLLNPHNEAELVKTSSFIVAKSALLADVFATVSCILTDQEVLLQLSKSNSFEFAQISTTHQLYKSQNFPEIVPVQ